MIMSCKVPMRNLGHVPGRDKPKKKKKKDRNTGTMACTQHVPQHNGFHDLHKGHVYFGQGLVGHVDP